MLYDSRSLIRLLQPHGLNQQVPKLASIFKQSWWTHKRGCKCDHALPLTMLGGLPIIDTSLQAACHNGPGSVHKERGSYTCMQCDKQPLLRKVLYMLLQLGRFTPHGEGHQRALGKAIQLAMTLEETRSCLPAHMLRCLCVSALDATPAALTSETPA